MEYFGKPPRSSRPPSDHDFALGPNSTPETEEEGQSAEDHRSICARKISTLLGLSGFG
jgi:hypothetical protein